MWLLPGIRDQSVAKNRTKRLASDFRLVLNGGETYAEVKPVSEFPIDVAQRVLGAGWTPVDLAA